MTHILILEGNTPEIIAAGDAASAGFVRTLLALDPAVFLRIASPYAAPIERSLFDGIDGVIFTGSATLWATDAPEVQPHRDAMELAFEEALPVWGSCNGMQLAAVVLGGSIGASPAGLEVGFARGVVPTEAGKAHPMLNGRSESFSAPTVHRDEVQLLPDGAVVLATNEHCQVQAMAVQHDGIDFWGTQYHPELSAKDIASYVRAPGIFESHMFLADDLEAASTDDSAAARVGTTVAEMAVGNRARELDNWLDHIRKRR